MAPVAAVVVLSGRIAVPVLEACVRPGSPKPPVLLFHGEKDLPDIFNFQEAMRDRMTALGIDNQSWMVPGAGHFYTREATAVAKATGATSGVEGIVAGFLRERLGLSGG